jgi:hypothetical protein
MVAFLGFIVGFIIGLCVNGVLLRDVPRETYLNDNAMRLRYGILNWLWAVLGAVVAPIVIG